MTGSVDPGFSSDYKVHETEEKQQSPNHELNTEYNVDETKIPAGSRTDRTPVFVILSFQRVMETADLRTIYGRQGSLLKADRIK